MAQILGILLIVGVIGGGAFLWLNRCEPWLINMGIPLCNVAGGDKINDEADASGIGSYARPGDVGKMGHLTKEDNERYNKDRPKKRPKQRIVSASHKGNNILSDKPINFGPSKFTSKSIPSSKYNILKSNLAAQSYVRMSY